jgi:hypothetical protein
MGVGTGSEGRKMEVKSARIVFNCCLYSLLPAPIICRRAHLLSHWIRRAVHRASLAAAAPHVALLRRVEFTRTEGTSCTANCACGGVAVGAVCMVDALRLVAVTSTWRMHFWRGAKRTATATSCGAEPVSQSRYLRPWIRGPPVSEVNVTLVAPVSSSFTGRHARA